MLDETIKERIKEIRKYYQLNQDDFGKKLGITRSVVVNIELGRAPIKNLLIDHVCDIYSINKEWLLFGTGEMLKSTEQNLLNELVKEFNLDEDELSIIKSYINLPKIQRKNFVSILKAMVNPPDEEKSYFHRYAGIWKKYDRCCDSKASGISVYRYRSYDTGAGREAAQGDY